MLKQTVYVPVKIGESIENGNVIVADKVSVIKNYGVREIIVTHRRLLEINNQYVLSEEQLIEAISDAFDSGIEYGNPYLEGTAQTKEQYIKELLK